LTFTLLATAQPQVTKENIAGASTVKVEQVHGTVIQVEGNHLAVRMSTGEVRTVDVQESRKFIIDGNELTVGQLKPGTKLTATTTTTITPITERTTTIATGKVWYVAGNTVIVTLPNNQNRQYKVEESYRFTVNGQKASVHDLRKGMIISGEKIVEEPRTQLSSTVAVTGEAPPPPQPKVAAAPATLRHEPAPEAAPAAPPAQEAERVAEPAPAAELPKTASEFPLIGLLGLASMAASLFVRKLRRS